MHDLHSHTSVATLIGAAALAADNTPAAVDLRGFQSAEVVLAIGIGGITFSGTNKIEFVLTHSDDDSTYTAVTDADMLGVTGITSGIIKSLIAAHAAAASYRFGYKGNKRYLKLLADFSGTHGTATPLAAVVVRGDPELAPVAAQA
jgi:2C-methyl-D-erythritol 2,4-cyclodiphosphate synthase